MFIDDFIRKWLLLFCVATTPLCSYAHKSEIEIEGKDYVYVLLSFDKKDNYPLMFAAILDSNDTLNINTCSVDSCILYCHICTYLRSRVL